MIDATTFLQFSGGVMGLVVSASLAYSQLVTAQIARANRRDLVEARALLKKQASAMEEIKINTNNLMTESLRNKGEASHAAGLEQGRQEGIGALLLKEQAEAAATVLREASLEAAEVVRKAAEALAQTNPPPFV
jgi:hypothetical protein